MMGWYDDGWGANWPAMVLMMLFWVALIGVAIWAAVRFVGSGPGAAGRTAAPTPRSVLDQRLASGEIDAEQYVQLRRLLDGRSAGAGTVDAKGQH